MLRKESAGKKSYQGQFSEGRRHGKGVQKYESGSVYDGEWQGRELVSLLVFFLVLFIVFKAVGDTDMENSRLKRFVLTEIGKLTCFTDVES